MGTVGGVARNHSLIWRTTMAGQRGEGGESGKISARCIPERRFAGLFGYTARESCQNQLILDTWRRCIATKGRYFRQRPPREYMAESYCHGKTLQNALRAVCLEAGKALFGRAAARAQDASATGTTSDNDGGVRWESRDC